MSVNVSFKTSFATKEATIMQYLDMMSSPKNMQPIHAVCLAVKSYFTLTTKKPKAPLLAEILINV